MQPLTLCSSSTEHISPIGERANFSGHTARPLTSKSVAPPPRFINPAKVNKEERCFGSYLNQQQLYKLRQKETQVVRKLQSKSILELQTLQHKALTVRASNKMKNLIQDALFQKHMAEMEEWESQLDVWSKDHQDEERTRTGHQETQAL